MTMDFYIEPWRKLYTRVDAKWLLLPVSARGLGSELIKYVDKLGCIPLGGQEPGKAVAYLMSARRSEHKRIASDIALLLKDGYLVLENDNLRIKNFVAAQDRSAHAKRQQKYRDKLSGRAQSSVTNSVTRDVSRDVSVSSPPHNERDGSRIRIRSPLSPPSGGAGLTPGVTETETKPPPSRVNTAELAKRARAALKLVTPAPAAGATAAPSGDSATVEPGPASEVKDASAGLQTAQGANS